MENKHQLARTRGIAYDLYEKCVLGQPKPLPRLMFWRENNFDLIITIPKSAPSKL